MYDANYMIFWKKQNYGDHKKISGSQGLGGGREGGTGTTHRRFLEP